MFPDTFERLLWWMAQSFQAKWQQKYWPSVFLGKQASDPKRLLAVKVRWTTSTYVRDKFWKLQISAFIFPMLCPRIPTWDSSWKVSFQDQPKSVLIAAAPKIGFAAAVYWMERTTNSRQWNAEQSFLFHLRASQPCELIFWHRVFRFPNKFVCSEEMHF